MITKIRELNKKTELAISLFQRYPFSDKLNIMYLDAKIGSLLSEIKCLYKEMKEFIIKNKNNLSFELKMEVIAVELSAITLFLAQEKEMERIFKIRKGA